MRSSVLVVGFALSSLLACTSTDSADSTDAQDQNVTGGSGDVQKPTVFLFENADAPNVKCAGAMLGKHFAVTAKTCAKVGMVVGIADDKDGKGARANIKTIHTPDAASDIVLAELDKDIGKHHALITYAPLRDGYEIGGVAATDGKGLLFKTKKGEKSSINGKLTSETETHSSLTPEKDQELCTPDIGAPVCSSTASKALGLEFRGTCGLSGIVVGPETETTKADGCSSLGWKVAQLGRHAEFLQKFVPEAFKPIDSSIPFVNDYVPTGLWGYKNKGEVLGCSVETTKLDQVDVNKESKVTTKVKFAGLQENATPFGRVGIAAKGEPTKIQWFPAKALGEQKGGEFESTYEGVVKADKAGDYIVTFRASATGGESWKACDKPLDLRVGPATQQPPPEGGTTPTTPTDPPKEPTTTTPKGGTTEDTSNKGDYSDPSEDDSSSSSSSSEDEATAEDPTEAPAAKKKKKTQEGCSTSSAPISSSSLPLLGLALGLAAIVRRRR